MREKQTSTLAPVQKSSESTKTPVESNLSNRSLIAHWTDPTNPGPNYEQAIRESAYYLYLERQKSGVEALPEDDWALAEALCGTNVSKTKAKKPDPRPVYGF